jgi:type II secretory pathway component GspD/PulD (secretin)
MAETLRRLLEQRKGVKVEVISIEDLLKPPDAKGSDASGHDVAEDGIVVAQRAEFAESKPTARGMHGWISAAVAVAAMAMQDGAPAAPAKPTDAKEARPAEDIVIAVDPVTNSLMIVGSPRMTEHLAALTAELERQMPMEPTRVRIVALPDGTDARALGQIVDQTVRQLGRATAVNPGGLTGNVSTIPDPTSGALIVWANDTDFGTVSQLIASISRLEATAALTVKIYPLSLISAGNAARAIEDMLGAQPRGRQATRFLRSLDITLLQGEGEEVRTKIDPTQIRVIADPSDTSLIVAGPAEVLPLVDAFIAMLDQSPVTEEKKVRNP